MKRIINILIIIVMLLSCSGRHDGGTDAVIIDSITYKPLYASGFDICTIGKSSLIRVKNPWQGQDSVPSMLFISQNGEQPPRNFKGQVAHGYPSRIVVMSSTNLAAFEALGVPQLVAGVSGKRFVSSKWLAENDDKVVDVGYDGNFNYEALLAAKPDLVLLYGVSGPSMMEAKLRELKIPYLYVADYLEESPLGKAEWIVALAEIAGVREQGESFFKTIPYKYNELKKIVADSVDFRPKVMLNAPYSDAWFLPSGENYFAMLLNDAGASYFFASEKGNVSQPVAFEKAYALLTEADFWLNPGTANTVSELTAAYPRLAKVQCVMSKNVFNNNRRATAAGGNDFFESGMLNPHVVLADLIKIFHPELLPEHRLVYYKQL